MNDGIAKPLCNLTYVTVIDTIQKILEGDCNTLLAKANIRRAFRLLPVHSIGTCLAQNIFIDTPLPFQGPAPKVFNILADLLSWAITQRGCTYVIHYLDNYLTISPPWCFITHSCSRKSAKILEYH